jgi:hypothetical protein
MDLLKFLTNNRISQTDEVERVGNFPFFVSMDGYNLAPILFLLKKHSIKTDARIRPVDGHVLGKNYIGVIFSLRVEMMPMQVYRCFYGNSLRGNIFAGFFLFLKKTEQFPLNRRTVFLNDEEIFLKDCGGSSRFLYVQPSIKPAKEKIQFGSLDGSLYPGDCFVVFYESKK